MFNQTMRLAPTLCPSLTQEICNKLREENVQTGIDLLLRDIEELSTKTRISYKVLQNICKVVNAYHGSVQISGLDLYNEALKACQVFSTGFEGLDKLLGGGFLAEEIVEMIGPPGSGKSTFCLSLSVHLAQTEKGRVIYIDPTYSVSPSFIRKVMLAKNSSLTEEAVEVLSHIRVFHPQDLWQLFALLEGLSKDEEQPGEERGDTAASSTEDLTPGRKVRLVVLDSLPQLVLPLIGGSQIESFGPLNHLATLMRLLAQKTKSPFLVVNNVPPKARGGEDALFCERKSTLGRYWTHVPHMRILLESSNDKSPEEKCCWVHITKSTRVKSASAQIDLHREA